MHTCAYLLIVLITLLYPKAHTVFMTILSIHDSKIHTTRKKIIFLVANQLNTQICVCVRVCLSVCVCVPSFVKFGIYVRLCMTMYDYV